VEHHVLTMTFHHNVNKNPFHISTNVAAFVSVYWLARGSRDCGSPRLKEENHYTFRTIPREHCLVEVSMARPS